MNFKQIELYGFKSFADRLEIKFNDGITAIVGPNGCGKSNVADAIRWVLGEQSAKLLRASNMQDVIFNGTEKRKSLSYCEVTLTFDNTKRYFDIDYDEISITRKLYRSGESEYLINKTPCRLKDIVSILHDSGMGKEGYSIIGQGKVEEIITSKPENRRAIFEDAAGISKFKARKVEAERRLERTNDNLSRVQDIIGEVERQLGPLKHQAENAKKYLDFKEKLKHFEVNNYIYQFDNASDQKAKIQTRIDGLSEEISLRNSEYEKKNNLYNDQMLEVNEIDRTLSELHNKILHLTVGLEKQAGETKLAEEKLKYLKNRQESLQSDLNRQKLNRDNTVVQIAQAEKYLEEQNNILSNLNNSAEEYNQSYLKIVDELAQSEDEATLKQQQMIEAMAQLGDIKSNMSALTAQKDALTINLGEVEDKLSILSEKIKQKNQEQSKLTSQIKEKSDYITECEEKLTNFTAELSELQRQLAEINSAIFNTNSNIQILENRQKALVEMQKEYDGFNYPIKRLMQDSTTNIKLNEKIVGVVASSMTIPQGFEVAIETALGNAVQNIITKNEDDAKDLIKYLKSNSIGRATFLPISSMRVHTLNPNERKFLSAKNCYGVASEIIKFDKSLQNIFNSLLGRTVIVATINDAVDLAKQSNFAFKIVTIDGDIINPQGSMSGGSQKAITSNILMRDNEINSLNENIKKLSTKLQDLESQKKKYANTLDGYKIQIESKSKEQIELKIDLAKLNETLQQVSGYIGELNGEKAGLNNEKLRISTKIEAIDLTMSQIGDKESSINNTRDDVNEDMIKRQEKFNYLKGQRDSYHDKLTSIRVQIASKEQEINSVNSEIDRLNNYLTETESLINQLSNSLDEVNKTLSGAQEIAYAKLDPQKQFEDQKELEIVKNKLAGLDEHKQQLQSSIKILDEDRTRLNNEVNNLLNKKYQEEFNLTKVDTDIEAMQERIFEEYELTYASCLEYKQENYDLYEGMAEANKLKREIARLGNVNVNAIEDSKLLVERYENLTTQANDLLKAKEDLLKIIKELSVEMITKFEAAFTQINANFNKVFKELFGGGNARLELTENEDPLLAGVEIVAEPPGKKLQSINLLSGGEKALTAIAILFAILKLRPMPFCLLDEIEAALDDSNVERFASYLKRFSQDTQFIVVTHRKPTMELADILYGVTMEEKGVSKLVSVKFDEAVKNAK